MNEDVNQTTLENLDADVVSKGNAPQKLLHYSIGFIERGMIQFKVLMRI